jgi:hypothetical protein
MQISDVHDKIGVVRHHRWISASEQEKILGQRCRIVVSLGGGKAKAVTLDELAKFTRPGTVIELVHVFLLADPRKKNVKGGMKASLAAAIALLVDKRGGVISDVDAGLTTEKAGHRKAMMALAEDQIGRSNKGLRSALNGAKSKGRPAEKFHAAELKNAKAAWRNVKDYPTWGDVAKALPEGFTTARAYKLFGKRL